MSGQSAGTEPAGVTRRRLLSLGVGLAVSGAGALIAGRAEAGSDFCEPDPIIKVGPSWVKIKYAIPRNRLPLSGAVVLDVFYDSSLTGTKNQPRLAATTGQVPEIVNIQPAPTPLPVSATETTLQFRVALPTSASGAYTAFYSGVSKLEKSPSPSGSAAGGSTTGIVSLRVPLK